MTQQRLGNFPRGQIATSIAALAIFACHDHAADERESGLRDQAALEQVVGHDLALDAIVKEAEDVAATGETARALDILKSRAVPSADVLVVSAMDAVVASPWAVERRDALLALARERRDEIPRYAAAIEANSPGAELLAMEAQLSLQRRAIELAASVARGEAAGSR